MPGTKYLTCALCETGFLATRVLQWLLFQFLGCAFHRTFANPHKRIGNAEFGVTALGMALANEGHASRRTGAHWVAGPVINSRFFGLGALMRFSTKLAATAAMALVLGISGRSYG